MTDILGRDRLIESSPQADEGASVGDLTREPLNFPADRDLRLHFGLGQKAKVDSLEIVWPSGMVTRLSDLSADQIIAVEEGKGVVTRPFPRVTDKNLR